MNGHTALRMTLLLLFGLAGSVGCAEPEGGRPIFRPVPIDDLGRVGPGLRAAYRAFEDRGRGPLIQVLELVSTLDFAEGDVVRVPLPDGSEAALRIRSVHCGYYAGRPATCVWSARTDDHTITMSFSYRRDRLGGLIYDTEVSGTLLHFRDAYHIETVAGYQFMHAAAPRVSSPPGE